MEKEGLPALGWAARDTSGHLAPYSFTRRSALSYFFSDKRIASADSTYSSDEFPYAR
jgi:hypothetical protein